MTVAVGFSPRIREAGLGFVAERRLTCGNRHALSIVADATPGYGRLIRGLKPTATVIKSLRDCKKLRCVQG